MKRKGIAVPLFNFNWKFAEIFYFSQQIIPQKGQTLTKPEDSTSKVTGPSFSQQEKIT